MLLDITIYSIYVAISNNTPECGQNLLYNKCLKKNVAFATKKNDIILNMGKLEIFKHKIKG